jgi:hypothetical protein
MSPHHGQMQVSRLYAARPTQWTSQWHLPALILSPRSHLVVRTPTSCQVPDQELSALAWQCHSVTHCPCECNCVAGFVCIPIATEFPPPTPPSHLTSAPTHRSSSTRVHPLPSDTC